MPVRGIYQHLVTSSALENIWSGSALFVTHLVLFRHQQVVKWTCSIFMTNMVRTIATDKALFTSENCWFLFLNENICCGYSLEAPQWGASYEYPQHMFSSRNKKNIMWIPPLICSYGLNQWFSGKQCSPWHLFFRENKTAREMFHKKFQVIFSPEKRKKIQCRLL